MLWPVREPVGLDRVQHRRLRGVGQQQHLVGVTAATARPFGRCVVAHQQHELVPGLDVVQMHRDAPVQCGIAGLAIRGAGFAERCVERLRVDHDHPPFARQLRGQLVGKAAQADAVADRQQRDRHRQRHRVAIVLRLQATDDLPRQRHRDLRAAGQQLREVRLGQPHQHRVADRHHAGRSRLVGVEAHLADDLAPAHLAHHARHAFFVAHVGPQPAADRQVHRVPRRTLLHQRLATGDLDPGQALAQQRHRGGLDVAEKAAQMLRQQRVVMLMDCGCCIGRHRPSSLVSSPREHSGWPTLAIGAKRPKCLESIARHRRLHHGPPPHHFPHRPDQRTRAAHPRVDAGDRALVSPRVDGAHPAVLQLGGLAQCGLQAGAGGYQPVPRWLEQPDSRDAAAGGAGRDGGDREDLPRGQEPAVDPREAHPQHVLPGQRAAPDADLSPGRPECPPGHARPRDQGADAADAGRRQHAGGRAAAAHARPPGHQGLRSLHDPAQQRSLRRHPQGAGKPARAVPAAAVARRLGRAAQDRTTSRATRKWPRSSPSCWAWTRG